jgi:ABC-type phosphate transport system auxiliary subunit
MDTDVRNVGQNGGRQLNPLVSQLIAVIQREISCLERFLTLLSEEQRFMVENDIGSLRKSMKEQDEAIRDQRQLEEARIKLTDSLAGKLKIGKKEINISKLIELVEESYSTELRELQSTLACLYARLERQRKKNEFLIRQSMKHLDKSIEVFLGLKSRESVQFASGEQSQEACSQNEAVPAG